MCKPTSYCVQLAIKILNRNDHVDKIIDQERSKWIEDLVKEVFEKEESEQICNIPVSRVGSVNKLIRGPSKKGVYSVNSAYYLAAENKRLEKGESSLVQEEDLR